MENKLFDLALRCQYLQELVLYDKDNFKITNEELKKRIGKEELIYLGFNPSAFEDFRDEFAAKTHLRRPEILFNRDVFLRLKEDYHQKNKYFG